jgi:hypothetical protein
MGKHLTRSIREPVRELTDWAEKWAGPDHGLIYCWERGRKMRIEQHALAARAERGELVRLNTWKGGVDKKLKIKTLNGSLYYLATWQGLRGQDLDIDLETPTTVICAKTGQSVVYGATPFRGDT